MRYRIRHISVIQTASMFALIYALLGLCTLPLLYLATRFAPDGRDLPVWFGGSFMLFVPIFYGGVGFVFTAIAASIYNLVASWLGGVEIDLADVEPIAAGSA